MRKGAKIVIGMLFVAAFVMLVAPSVYGWFYMM